MVIIEKFLRGFRAVLLTQLLNHPILFIQESIIVIFLTLVNAKEGPGHLVSPFK